MLSSGIGGNSLRNRASRAAAVGTSRVAAVHTRDALRVRDPGVTVRERCPHALAVLDQPLEGEQPHAIWMPSFTTSAVSTPWSSPASSIERTSANACSSAPATWTSNVAVDELPLSSVAVHVTLVDPIANCSPDAGTHSTVGLGSHVSTAVAA